MTDDDIIGRILKFEGGFVNNPLDKGGPTNFGITASELGRVRGYGRAATVAEVQGLPVGEAIAIYKSDYIAIPGFDQLTNDGLRMIIVDSAVLHGVARATKWLQQALGVTIDGVIGSQTLNALTTPVGSYAARGVLALRFKFLGSLLTTDPKQVVFAAGWLSRAADLLQFA